MRPALLDPLFAPAGALAGVGPKNAKLFDKLLGRPQGARVLDVLFHLPYAALDRRARPKIVDAQRDAIATIEVRVVEHRASAAAFEGAVQGAGRGRHRRRRTGVLSRQPRMDQEAPAGRRDALGLGQARDVGRPSSDGASRPRDGRRGAGENAGGRAGLRPHGRPLSARRREGRPGGAGARARPAGMDRPADGGPPAERRASPTRCKPSTIPRRPATSIPSSLAATRLAYDELLANQLALLLVRSRMRDAAGRANVSAGRIAGKILKALPFELTGAQGKAVEEIRADLASPKRMIRLLQGDVGAGKTIVALIAMADVVEAGRQAAMMAPTEILARQHFERMKPLALAAGLQNCPDDGARQGGRAATGAGGAGGGRYRHSRRHPRFVSGERGVSRSRARGRRRAASLRRAPETGARRQGRSGRSPGR